MSHTVQPSRARRGTVGELRLRHRGGREHKLNVEVEFRSGDAGELSDEEERLSPATGRGSVTNLNWE